MPENAIDTTGAQATEDDTYVGTDPIYQNHAYDETKPIAASDSPEKALFDRVNAESADRDKRSVTTNRRGVLSNAVHPSQRRKGGVVASKTLEGTEVSGFGEPTHTLARPTHVETASSAPAAEAPAPKAKAAAPAKD